MNLIIKRVVISIMKWRIKKSFKQNAIIGNHFSVLISAKVVNCIGDKNRIIIGDNCEIGARLHVEDRGTLTIGHHTTIRGNTYISSVANIKIGDYVIISNHCIIRDHNSHPTSPSRRLAMSKSGFYSDLWSNRHAESLPIVIKDNVWIGEKSIILKGITIEVGAIVATGSVVTKDVPPYTIVAGNPAKIVKELKNG